MRKEEFCKPLLEKILGVKIKKIVYAKDEVDITAAIPGAKSVRLDVYVEDDDNTVYDIEVQTTNKRNLGKRTRYYQSMIDIRVLEAGQNYRKLKKSFVIFICNYDPFGENRYIYTFQNHCNENLDLVLDDEATKIIINTKGKVGDISDELKAVIKYMDSGDATDEYTEDLAKEVESVKFDEKVRKEYMLLAEAYAEQRMLERGRIYVRQIRKMMNQLSIDQITFFLDITLPECEEVINLIKEHPDWDDEQVAMEIDWED